MNVLDRPGEQAGIDYWLTRRSAGMPTRDLLIAFADSPENIDRTGTVQPLDSQQSKVLRLYKAAFGRSPDNTGFAYWTDTYRKGATLGSIAGQFATSAEWVQRYGESPTDEQLVDALYQQVLGRPGDDAGRGFWLASLADGLSRTRLLEAFSESPENITNTGTIP